MAIPSFLARVIPTKQTLRSIPQNALVPRYGDGWHQGHGLRGFAVDKVERWGGAYGFGVLKGHYKDRFFWRDQPIDKVVGVGASIVAVLLNANSYGTSTWAAHLERLGDVAMASWLNTIGVAHGAGGWGAKFLPPIRVGEDVLGYIPPAKGGAFLSAAEVAEYSGPRV